MKSSVDWADSRPRNLLDRSTLIHSRVELSSTQKQVDGLVDGFVHQATDWKSLAAMTAGGMAYRLGRVGILAAGGREMGILLQGASVIGGLSAEVASFELSHRSLASLSDHSPNSRTWKWNGPGGMGQGLFQSFITFGALKSMGRLTQNQNLILQHGAQDVGMVLGHQVAHHAGVAPKPEGTLAEQFLHAEITNLQIGAGMALGHQLAGGKVQAVERALDLSASNKFPDLQDKIRSSPLPSPLLAMASAGNRNEGPAKHVHFLLAEKKGEGAKDPKPKAEAASGGQEKKAKLRKLTRKFITDVFDLIVDEYHNPPEDREPGRPSKRLIEAFLSLPPNSRYRMALELKDWMDREVSVDYQTAASGALRDVVDSLTAKERNKLAHQIMDDLIEFREDYHEESIRERMALIKYLIPSLEPRDQRFWFVKAINNLDRPGDWYLTDALGILSVFLRNAGSLTDYLVKRYEELLTVQSPDVKGQVFKSLAVLVPRLPLEKRLSLTLKIEEQLAALDSATESSAIMFGTKALGDILPHLPEQNRLARAFQIQKSTDAVTLVFRFDTFIRAIRHLRREDRLAFALSFLQMYWDSPDHDHRQGSIPEILEEIIPHVDSDLRPVVGFNIISHLDAEALRSVIEVKDSETWENLEPLINILKNRYSYKPPPRKTP